MARLAGFGIRIQSPANLVRSDARTVYGILATAAHHELARLTCLHRMSLANCTRRNRPWSKPSTGSGVLPCATAARIWTADAGPRVCPADPGQDQVLRVPGLVPGSAGKLRPLRPLPGQRPAPVPTACAGREDQRLVHTARWPGNAEVSDRATGEAAAVAPDEVPGHVRKTVAHASAGKP